MKNFFSDESINLSISPLQLAAISQALELFILTDESVIAEKISRATSDGRLGGPEFFKRQQPIVSALYLEKIFQLDVDTRKKALEHGPEDFIEAMKHYQIRAMELAIENFKKEER